jgi:hypothetical protein
MALARVRVLMRLARAQRDPALAALKEQFRVLEAAASELRARCITALPPRAVAASRKQQQELDAAPPVPVVSLQLSAEDRVRLSATLSVARTCLDQIAHLVDAAEPPPPPGVVATHGQGPQPLASTQPAPPSPQRSDASSSVGGASRARRSLSFSSADGKSDGAGPPPPPSPPPPPLSPQPPVAHEEERWAWLEPRAMERELRALLRDARRRKRATEAALRSGEEASVVDGVVSLSAGARAAEEEALALRIAAAAAMSPSPRAAGARGGDASEDVEHSSDLGARPPLASALGRAWAEASFEYFLALVAPHSSHPFGAAVASCVAEWRTRGAAALAAGDAAGEGACARALLSLIGEMKGSLAAHAQLVLDNSRLAARLRLAGLDPLLQQELLRDAAASCRLAVEHAALPPLFHAMLSWYARLNAPYEAAVARAVARLRGAPAERLGVPPFFQLLPHARAAAAARERGRRSRRQESSGAAPADSAPPPLVAAASAPVAPAPAPEDVAAAAAAAAAAALPYAKARALLSRALSGACDSWHRKADLLVLAVRAVSAAVCDFYRNVVDPEVRRARRRLPPPAAHAPRRS